MTVSLVIPLLIGLLSGIAANYVADSLPMSRRLGRPVCAQCGIPYAWRSYLTGGACPSCGHKRGLRTWIVLVIMILLSAYSWLQPHRLGFAFSMLLLTYFAVVVIIDLEHRLILHPTSAVGALLAAGIGIWARGLGATLLGGLIGTAVMLVLYGIGLAFSRMRNRRLAAAGREPDGDDALGWGDVILGGILGLLLGWPLIGLGLFLGILIGGIVGLAIIAATIVRGSYRKQALMVFMPYGPSFILSSFLILFVPEMIANLVPK